jgi:hydroxymethylbilane synthase
MIRAATRSSPLARWQTDHVASLLRAHSSSSVELIDPVYVDTLGDRTQALGTPLHSLGGQGVFSKEVQAAVLEGRAEIAVHSAKDLASVTADGLVIAAIPARGDVRDVLIGSTLDGLREGAVVGTGSVRRRAQLAALRPDLQFAEVRGNVGTRIGKLSQFDAIVLAHVPLHRLGLWTELSHEQTVEVLPVSLMLPMIGQGALAIECRADDQATIAALSVINDPESWACVTAERTFLSMLGAGCDLPVACLAEPVLAGGYRVRALVASADGTTVVRAEAFGEDVALLGVEVAESVLSQGAADLLRAAR